MSYVLCGRFGLPSVDALLRFFPASIVGSFPTGSASLVVAYAEGDHP
jgi:hypothetical protein